MSSLSGWKAGTKLLRINFKSTGQYFRFFSTGHAHSSPSLKVNHQELIEISDPPVIGYQGYSLEKEAETYFASCGLKNALYLLNAKDLKEDLFGILVPCPFQEPTVASPIADLPEKISVTTDEPVKEHLKLEYSSQQKQPSDNSMSCTLEFDGAPAGKASKGGAGVILRTEDGSVISRLREGLGAVTNDTADYRALILGLRHALKKGFKQIHVLGDSQLVCMQVQGLSKAKNKNLVDLCEEAKALKEMFVSFSISHIKKMICRRTRKRSETFYFQLLKMKMGQLCCCCGCLRFSHTLLFSFSLSINVIWPMGWSDAEKVN
ncbi:uncharacterized protein LOC135586174 isoform X3 [Musa acuminata AAA Group]|uniref:uncharacterized protein LOC135586174 isoform X3 n=1 Tax=Musa acuminata AAA Group TaxID=214697 RepID=UPI0031DBDBA2